MLTALLLWLRKMLDRLIGQEARYDVYQPRERMIYRYFDGQKQAVADPLVLYKRMMKVGPELAIDMKVSVSQHKDAEKGHNAVVRKVQEIFGVKCLEEGGLGEVETVELLDHFLTYCGQVKKNTKTSPTSSTSWEAASPISGDGPIMPSSSGSGCAASGSATAEPALSASESPSLSA